jgi:predicted dehydrogenase
VLVGVVGLELSRADFYEKELSLQVSCSYGPGRYDPLYEERGQDYPFGFVRWTEKRNFEAILNLMASDKINIQPLITHRFNFEQAKEAYEILAENAGTGILLKYSLDEIETKLKKNIQLKAILTQGHSKVTIGLIGPGNHASRTLIPSFKKTQATFKTIVSSQGMSAAVHGARQAFDYATTEIEQVLSDPAINTLVIATRPASHAKQIIAALHKGKHVYVEKPLVVSQLQLDKVKNCYENLVSKPLLMVGFNRRFAPFCQSIKKILSKIQEPKAITITVNPGFIPLDNWIHDSNVGGGRLISEACHFIDLARFFVGYPIINHHAYFIDDTARDKAIFCLQFADGSLANINYLPNGHQSFPKERIEIFCAGKIMQIDNFLKMKGYGCSLKKGLFKQNKGQNECVAAFVNAIKNSLPPPIPYEEIIEVMQVTLDVTAKIIKSTEN